MNDAAFVIVALVVLQRLWELARARSNTKALLARGAVELGRSHYPLIVGLHAAWLAAILWFMPAPAMINWPLLCVFAVLQGLRIWVLLTLGPYWTTRIITLPGTPLITGGPYRFVRHPNYLVVAGEIAVLPLVFGEVWVAIGFSLANAALLFWRIRQEENGIKPRRVPGAMKGFTLWLGFGAMCLGLFMAVLDIQVVASALTTIGASLRIAPQRLGWIQTGYLMAEVIAIPLTGILTRSFSLRWMFVSATLGFTLASLACAYSSSFGALIAFRVIQGFCGGMLIPAVFTSIFVMMPKEREILATTMAGLFAMTAPTVGPFVGGFLTEHFSWRWIFLVNILPGLLVGILVAACVKVGEAEPKLLRKLDYVTLILASVFLASLQLLLNEAPSRDWKGAFVFSVAAVCIAAAAAGVWRALGQATPFIDLRRFRHRAFSLGCGLSFVFGMGLYGSVYILALFLGLVRGHSPLEIGEIMMVSGAAQLLMAPVAAMLETRIDNRFLVAVGFVLFGLGLFANGLATPRSEFWGLFWPQILRGAAVMLCILPATRLALEGWDKSDVADASGLFNLLRNLGGAIGIALVDTLVEMRTPGHVGTLVTRLQAGDAAAAKLVGLPIQMFRGHAMGPVDEMTKAIVAPLVQRAALTLSLNEAWMALAILFALSLLMVPAIRSSRR